MVMEVGLMVKKCQLLMFCLGKLACLIGDHDWTSAAEQGIQPTKEQLKLDIISGFKDYAKMYCKRCGKIYHGSP